ncbi:MAG: hypothetical protein KDJ99_29235, partial [Candidatus Competibacteraceae bacterium]|nr:hypothetical protein [Candidatus Competibacteraceae bacterium]
SIVENESPRGPGRYSETLGLRYIDPARTLAAGHVFWCVPADALMTSNYYRLQRSTTLTSITWTPSEPSPMPAKP